MVLRSCYESYELRNIIHAFFSEVHGDREQHNNHAPEAWANDLEQSFSECLIAQRHYSIKFTKRSCASGMFGLTVEVGAKVFAAVSLLSPVAVSKKTLAT